MKVYYNGRNATDGTELTVDEFEEFKTQKTTTIEASKAYAFIATAPVYCSEISIDSLSGATYEMFFLNKKDGENYIAQPFENGAAGVLTFTGPDVYIIPVHTIGFIIKNTGASSIDVKFNF